MNIAEEILENSNIKTLLDQLYLDILKDGKIENNNITNLKKHFSCSSLSQNPEEIYSSSTEDFFLKYGLTNLIKNYYVVSEIHQLGIDIPLKNILDIGSGPGIFTLAYLFWLSENKYYHKDSSRIIMIELVGEFLKLFGSIWKDLKISEKKLFKIKKIQGLIDGAIPKELPKPDMIVFSNSLTEVLRDSRTVEENLFQSLIEIQPIIFIIDYKYTNTDSLLQNFTNVLKNHFYNISCYDWPYWNEFFQIVNLNEIEYPFNNVENATQKVVSNVKFLKSILIPKKRKIKISHTNAADIVMKYKEAWENHDIKIIHKLFTQDAQYQEKQNKEALKGIQNICNYWNYNSKNQKDITFKPLFIHEKDNNLKCIWECKFYRTDLAKWMFLKGVFNAKISNNKIHSFSESFEKELIEKN